MLQGLQERNIICLSFRMSTMRSCLRSTLFVWTVRKLVATIATKERVGLIMKNGKISMEEAEERAWEGADEIEALLARRNGESDEDGNDSRKYFATQFMSL